MKIIILNLKKLFFPLYFPIKNYRIFLTTIFGNNLKLALQDFKIRFQVAKLLSYGDRYRMYQPIPFKEFDDISPARSRACDMRWKELSKYLPKNMEGITVLDLGAAEGYFGLQCAKRGAKVTAIEFFPGKSRLIRLLAKKFKLDSFSVITDDISNIDLIPLGSFDYIFYLNIHQHIYKRSPDRAAKKLYEISKICKKNIFFETRPVQFSDAIASLRPDNPQPFQDIETTLKYVKDSTTFDQDEELFYNGYDLEPDNCESIPDEYDNIYRLFILKRSGESLSE
jgi:hypothetical protein